MTESHTTILTTVFHHLDSAGRASPVEVQLRYESVDPYAVRMIFHAGQSSQVEWVMARDLLAEGLITASGSGEGDVQVSFRPDQPAFILITLNSDSGQASFETSADRLGRFLDATYDHVLPGDEHRWMNIDEALSRLLPNGAGQ